MRTQLLYEPLLLMERLGEFATTRRRLRRLRTGPAAPLHDGHIDTLELLDLLRPMQPKVIYDIGANVGTWTLLAKAVFPRASLHAFEPLPQHAATFATATAALDGVALHEVALGAENGAISIKVTSFSDASSVLPLTDAGRSQWRLSTVAETPVEQRRLDNFVASRSMPWPDVIKLDTQGYELEVLRGAPTTLAHAGAVIAEVSFREFYAGQCRFDEIVSFLAEHGFFVHAFGKRTSLGQPLAQADVLFLKPPRTPS